MMGTLNRRDMLSASALATGSLLTAGTVSLKAEARELASALQEDSVVLFQGDSITDAGREKNQQGANDARALGRGYAFMISAAALAEFPAHKLQCHNRGISGNKVPDLDKRWDEDCIHLKPKLLSILIGVNDIWHKLNGNYDGTVQGYEEQLAALLERTRKALPDTKIVICEPFVLRCGAVNDNWFPEFDQRRAACKKVAEEAATIWVPFQTMFDEAVANDTTPAYWAGDGVHPTIAGHALMAKTWLQTVTAALGT
ncbi:MAG: SGNH/GDSL hydrolase family protein [Pirellulaceae bacterium]